MGKWTPAIVASCAAAGALFFAGQRYRNASRATHDYQQVGRSRTEDELRTEKAIRRAHAALTCKEAQNAADYEKTLGRDRDKEFTGMAKAVCDEVWRGLERPE